MRSPYTPGAGGYLLAIVVALLVLPFVPALVAFGFDPGHLRVDLGFVVLVVFFGIVPAAVIGPLGALLVHYTCRSQPNQCLHVLAAGASAIVVPALVWMPFAPGDGPSALDDIGFAFMPVAIAAMIGRAAVIPLVPACRARRARPAVPR